MGFAPTSMNPGIGFLSHKNRVQWYKYEGVVAGYKIDGFLVWSRYLD